MTSAALVSALQAIFLVGCVLTAGKLFSTGLHKRYLVFFLYFLFRIPNSIWPFFVDIRSYEYFSIWRITTVMALIFYVALIAELYRLVLEKYRGLQTAGRWAMFASLGISVGISLLALLPKMNSMSLSSRRMRIILDMERSVCLASALFIFLLLAFLSRYPIRLSRNVRLHAIVYSAFFLSSTMSVLLVRLFGIPMDDTANLIVSCINTCTVYVWLVFLNRAGEEVPSVDRTALREQRLLTQLDTMNAALLRVSRQHSR